MECVLSYCTDVGLRVYLRPRESVNKIKDEAWTERSQAHCMKAEDIRFALEDLTEMNPNDSLALQQKSKIVEKATDALENAINLIAKINRPMKKVKQSFLSG